MANIIIIIPIQVPSLSELEIFNKEVRFRGFGNSCWLICVLLSWRYFNYRVYWTRQTICFASDPVLTFSRSHSPNHHSPLQLTCFPQNATCPA